MPYIVSTAWYPLSLSDTVAQRYLEILQKYPIISSIKRIVPAAVTTTKEGIEVFIVDEVKREDVGAAFDYLAKFLIEFRNIEGFNYQIRNLSTLNEAMKYIGK
jgi:hypothetical protein